MTHVSADPHVDSTRSLADDLAKAVRVDDALARALGMWDTNTTTRGLARYVHEQLRLDEPDYFEMRPEAVRFLAALAHGLTPPEDRQMRFEQLDEAAANAVPRSCGEALDTMVAMGWGNDRIDASTATPRAIGDVIRSQLGTRARCLAMVLVEEWERAGHVSRLY
jgi:hypothetical protein